MRCYELGLDKSLRENKYDTTAGVYSENDWFSRPQFPVYRQYLPLSPFESVHKFLRDEH